MIRKYSLLALCVVMFIALFACSDNHDKEDIEVATETNAESEKANNENDINDNEEIASESLTLPDGFPTDFPLPDHIKITEVEDDSDESRYSFEIRFTFEPSIDMDATFKMYDEYAKKLEYNIIIGGEEYFADGVFQFGATSKFSASDMFVVTLKPEDPIFGDIQLKVSK